MDELAICRRELCFCAAKLEQTQLELLDQGRREREVAAVRSSALRFSAAVSRKHEQGLEAVADLKVALDAADDELRRMSAEVVAAEQESHVASLSCEHSGLEAWRELQSLTQDQRDAEHRAQDLHEDCQSLELLLAGVQSQLVEECEAKQQHEMQLTRLEGELEHKLKAVIAYELGARALQQELRTVLLELRKGHEEAEHERQRLMVRIDYLEGLGEAASPFPNQSQTGVGSLISDEMPTASSASPAHPPSMRPLPSLGSPGERLGA